MYVRHQKNPKRLYASASPAGITKYGRIGEEVCFKKETILIIGPIYTRDRSSVWDEFGQRTVVRLVIRLCMNTGFQTDHPSGRTITVVRLSRRTTVIVRLDG